MSCRCRRSFWNPKACTSSNRWPTACRWSSRGTGRFPNSWRRPAAGGWSPPGDPDELADAFEELQSDADTRHALGATGQINVREQFNPEVMAAATLDVLRS